MAQEAQAPSCVVNMTNFQTQVDLVGGVLTAGAQIGRGGPNELVFDPYLYEGGCWSTDRGVANSCTNPRWESMGPLAKAEYIRLTYEELLAVHGMDYSPRILTCKTVRESCLRPQDQASTSTAVGLSQVTASTARDLFVRAKWFKPRVAGFQDVSDGDKYHDRMRSSVAAQMELGLAVLHQKSRDFKTSNIRIMLGNYYGLDAESNKEYSDAIYDCADCIKGNQDRLSMDCLNKARNSCF
jgi:hypothetical protein